MSSNLYLFDPKQAQPNAVEKPLIQVMHEAQIARSEASARIVKNLVSRVRKLFVSQKPAAANNSVTRTVEAPVDKERLAA